MGDYDVHDRLKEDTTEPYIMHPHFGHHGGAGSDVSAGHPRKKLWLHIKSTDILYGSTNGDGSCGFRALRQASKRAGIQIHPRANTPIKDVDYYDKTDRKDQIALAENILNTSSAAADISTLRLYVEWLKIPYVPEPGVTDRSRYEELQHGLNDWMSTNDCHSLAAILSYRGLFTIVGRALLHKATYLFYTNS